VRIRLRRGCSPSRAGPRSVAQAARLRPRHLLAASVLALCLAGCAVGPHDIATDRLRYNEVIKSTSEQQLLLNIVRLRYTDTPSSLAVTSVATQSELVGGLQLVPLFGVAGGDVQARGLARVLPGGQISGAVRPTVSFTPLDDQEFSRKLFTPMSLEGVLYLAKTTWPISTVFRLYLENLNWISNAETASGPTPVQPPEFTEFLRGVQALQVLQDRGDVVFATEEREEKLGSDLPDGRVAAHDLIDAAKEGFEYRSDPQSGRWSLIRKRSQPVLKFHPGALKTREGQLFTQAFHLKADRHQFDLVIEKLDPFADTYPLEGVDMLELETRSLLQVLYFVSKGVEVPPAQATARLARTSALEDGSEFPWVEVTRGLFHVHWSSKLPDPATAHCAVRYLDHWYYIDKRDHETMSTFSLLMELARLELGGKTAAGPTLTLPVGR
jgi:hypothetical protein